MSGLLYMSANVLHPSGSIVIPPGALRACSAKSSATSGPAATRIMNGFVKPNFAVLDVALVAARYHPIENVMPQQPP